MTELPDDEALAAEYVIGTLDSAERRAAELRLRRDSAFEALVDAWTARLAPLLDTIPAKEPAPELRDAILADVGGLLPTQGFSKVNVIHLRRQVRVWRLVASSAAALAAALALWIAIAVPTKTSPSTYMAVLQQGSGAPAFLVSLDLRSRRMTVIPSAVTAAPDKSLELWMIEADRPVPLSLGVVEVASPIKASLPDIRPDLISTATYAITLEPKGGSPDGKPSSPPIYVGHLVEEPK